MLTSANVPLHRNVIGGLAGLTADANSLVNYARTAAQQHLLAYDEEIPVELLAQRLCDMKQGYTQYGGSSRLPCYPYTLLSFPHVIIYTVLTAYFLTRPPPLRCLPPLRGLRPPL